MASYRSVSKLSNRPINGINKKLNHIQFKYFSSKPTTKLDFENHLEVFKSKTIWEISRALAVLGICSYEKFVNNSIKLLNVAKRYAGDRLVNIVVRKTFYDHFVAGDQTDQLAKVIKRLATSNVKPMIVCTMEEDIGESSGSETIYDRNLTRIQDCLDLIASTKSDQPLMQLKLTSLVNCDVLLRLSEAISKGDFNRSMVIAKLSNPNKNQEKLSESISNEDCTSINFATKRLSKIGQTAIKNGIRLLIDAEFTYVNPAISLLALFMMNELNKTETNVYHTYQCYLKDSLKELNSDMKMAKSMGVTFGVKLVRGAYISTERQRALSLKQIDPIWDTYEDTNMAYNKALSLLLDEIKTLGPRCNLIAATHNEQSVLYVVNRMKEMGLPNSCPTILFGQIYGMCDQVTYPLASNGYNAYKSVPFGPLYEALPYLARRATENQAVLAGARKERELLRKSFRHRLLRF